MNIEAYIPTDPGEIEHVIDLLRGDLRPEYRKLVREGKMREYGVLPRLRDALKAKIAPHVPEWQRHDLSDFAHLTANTRYAEWVRAAASAICNLHRLERAADERADDGVDPADDRLDWFPEWGRLRAALIEVALSLTYSDLIDQEKKAERAEAHAKALAEAAKQAEVFRSGRKKGAIASHNAYLRDILIDHPGRTAKEVAKLVRDRCNKPDCPFEVDGDIDRLRATGEPINLEAAIENVRKRHVNRSDSAI